MKWRKIKIKTELSTSFLHSSSPVMLLYTSAIDCEIWNELFISHIHGWRPIHMPSRVCVCVSAYQSQLLKVTNTGWEEWPKTSTLKKNQKYWESKSPSDKQIYIWSSSRTTWHWTITKLPSKGSVVSQQVFRNSKTTDSEYSQIESR